MICASRIPNLIPAPYEPQTGEIQINRSDRSTRITPHPHLHSQQNKMSECNALYTHDARQSYSCCNPSSDSTPFCGILFSSQLLYKIKLVIVCIREFPPNSHYPRPIPTTLLIAHSYFSFSGKQREHSNWWRKKYDLPLP